MADKEIEVLGAPGDADVNALYKYYRESMNRQEALHHVHVTLREQAQITAQPYNTPSDLNLKIRAKLESPQKP